MKENFIFDTKRAFEYFKEKTSFEIQPRELHKLIKNNIENINIIDVREYDDYIDGHIPYAIHVPLNDFENHFVMLEKDKTNIVYGYCPYCACAYKAAVKMSEKHYPTRVLNGGIKIWQKFEYDIVKTSSNYDK